MAITPNRTGYFPLTFSDVITGNTAYTAAHTLIFEGSDLVGVPVGFYIIGGIVDSGAFQDIRVFDITNSQVICEVTGITDFFPTLINLGTISNVPTGMAIWQVQHMSQNTPGPDGDVSVASAFLEFR